MSPASPAVLVAAAAISSPALWSAFVDGATTAETALIRYVICAGICWAAFAVLEMLIGPAPRPAATPDDAPTHEAEPAT